MGDHVKNDVSGTITLSEIREFASFTAGEQRYIRRSLDIAFGRDDALALWSRDDDEMRSMTQQKQHYRKIGDLKKATPKSTKIDGNAEFFANLMALSAFDIMSGRLDSFAAYRFLYERLLGANVRPWLPAVFCGTASLPQLKPLQRKKLLQSISEAAATAVGWSQRNPSFFPEWVEKVDSDY